MPEPNWDKLIRWFHDDAIIAEMNHVEVREALIYARDHLNLDYRCPACGYPCKDAEALEKHNKLVHGG